MPEPTTIPALNDTRGWRDYCAWELRGTADYLRWLQRLFARGHDRDYAATLLPKIRAQQVRLNWLIVRAGGLARVA